MNDNRIATLDELLGVIAKRRFKGGANDVVGDLKGEPLTLPVSGLRIRIQSLTESELSEFNALQLKKDGTGLSMLQMKDATRKLIALCLVDEQGNRIVPDNKRGLIAQWDSADSQFAYTECATWVGLKSDFMETFAKNSSTTIDAD
jgi:hypothetical protein